MVKVFRCRDTGSNCDFVGRGSTLAETVQISVTHVHQAHGMPMDKALEAYVAKNLKAE